MFSLDGNDSTFNFGTLGVRQRNISGKGRLSNIGRCSEDSTDIYLSLANHFNTFSGIIVHEFGGFDGVV